MDKLFPPMYTKPENHQILITIPCLILVFILIPMFMPIVGLGLWEQWEKSVWLEIVYHIMNGILLLFVMGNYLKDEWFMVSTNVKYYLKHVALTVGLIVLVEALFMGTLFLLGLDFFYMANNFPLVEMSVSHTPLAAVEYEPIFSTITASIFSPISVCALFYCLVFAPVCNYKPWLAYLSVAAITAFPAIVDILWRGEAEFVLTGYIVSLPVHLLACWSYQKTDNVWTPMLTVGFTNLLASVLIICLLPLA